MCRIFRIEPDEKNKILITNTEHDMEDDDEEDGEEKENLIYRYTIQKIIKYIN